MLVKASRQPLQVPIRQHQCAKYVMRVHDTRQLQAALRALPMCARSAVECVNSGAGPGEAEAPCLPAGISRHQDTTGQPSGSSCAGSGLGEVLLHRPHCPLLVKGLGLRFGVEGLAHRSGHKELRPAVTSNRTNGDWDKQNLPKHQAARGPGCVVARAPSPSLPAPSRFVLCWRWCQLSERDPRKPPRKVPNLNTGALGAEAQLAEHLGLQSVQHLQLLQSNGATARSLMLRHNLRLIVHVAQRYADRGVDRSILVEVGFRRLSRPHRFCRAL